MGGERHRRSRSGFSPVASSKGGDASLAIRLYIFPGRYFCNRCEWRFCRETQGSRNNLRAGTIRRNYLPTSHRGGKLGQAGLSLGRRFLGLSFPAANKDRQCDNRANNGRFRPLGDEGRESPIWQITRKSRCLGNCHRRHASKPTRQTWQTLTIISTVIAGNFDPILRIVHADNETRAPATKSLPRRQVEIRMNVAKIA